jgi:CRISPR/Cas system-associated exonuclease Cas4 (RecB family)
MTTITKEYQVLDLRKALLDGLRTEYNKPRVGIHASDLVNCRRQVCFERIAGRRTFSENTLMYFCSGEFEHQKLESILGPDYDCEREIIHNGIVFHPDAIYRPDNAVIEIKTARTDSVVKEPKETHIRQLKYYMAALNAPYGILQYIILNKYENMFPSHFVTFKDDRERQEILDKLERDSLELEGGIVSKHPEYVKHIATDLEYMIKVNGKSTGRNWLCSSCDFKKECDAMRAEAGEFRAKTTKAIAVKETQILPESWK